MPVMLQSRIEFARYALRPGFGFCDCEIAPCGVRNCSIAVGDLIVESIPNM
jgi:hypothetical protein